MTAPDRDHRHLREELGPYVLGALEPAERRHVEQHVVDCPACRDELSRLTVLPTLLDRLSPQEAADDRLVPPPTLRPGLVAVALADRDRLARGLRTWRVTSLVAAAAAVVVLLAWAPWSRSDPDRWQLDPVTATAAVDGSAAALAWEWGTTVELAVEDLPEAERYVLWAVADDGRREQAGTWGPTASGAARVRGASAIQRDDLARIEVTADGRTLVAFDVVPPE